MGTRRQAPEPRVEMTTTVTLPTALMERAKILAIRQHTSFKAVVIAALEDYLMRHEPEGGHR